MNVSWVPLNLVEAQGIIRDYIIMYQPTGSRRKRQMQTVQADGNSSYAIVGGLQPGVAYEVTVSGMTTQTGPGEHECSMGLEVALVSHKTLLRTFVLSHVSTLPKQLFSSFSQYHPQHKFHQNPQVQ